MWPFPDKPVYSGSDGKAPPVTTPSVPKSAGWCLGGNQPVYVPPNGASGGGATSIDIVNPPLSGSSGAGPILLVKAPVGARTYKLWLSPTKAIAPGTPVNVVPIGVDIADQGVLPGDTLTITPLWVQIGPEPLPPGVVRATLLVEFG